MPLSSTGGTSIRSNDMKHSCEDNEDCSIMLWGRGGQGIVTAGELLALAAYTEKKYAQAIPHFGAERRGGPTSCSVRISSHPILLKCNVITADVICIFESSIMDYKNLLNDINSRGIILIITNRSAEEIVTDLKDRNNDLKIPSGSYSIFTIDASSLAMEIFHSPLINTALIGAFSRATRLISIKSIVSVIRTQIKRDVEKNIEITKRAYDDVEGFQFVVP